MNQLKKSLTLGALAWDDRYSKETFHYGTEANDFLKTNFEQIPREGRVLCLAEGEGRNAIFLARLGFHVTAVDQSIVGLRKLSSWAIREGLSVETIVTDLADFNPGVEKWDSVVLIWCHLPPGLRAQVHQRVCKGLRAGGVVILEAYHPRQLEYKTGGPQSSDLMMTAEMLKVDFKSLKVDFLETLDREVHEGEGHFGKSAVVQLIARRIL